MFFRIVLFVFLFSFKGFVAQNLKVLSTETKQAVENVAVLFYENGNVIKLNRSDFEGNVSIPLNYKWDSIIMYRLGYKKMTIQDRLTTNVVFIVPLPNVIEEVMITGQIIPGNKYQSPFNLKYYTAEEIKSKKSVNLAEFLQTENNFSVTQDPLLGTKVSMNGMSGADIKVMIDGVPIIGRINGNLDFSQILLNNIERIETVGGPLSAIYGTNATGGVINLITKTGTNNSSDLNANLYSESVGVFNANVNYNINIKGHKANIGLGRNVFLGWDQNADSLSNSIKPIWRDVAWNPKEQYFINTSYYRALSKKIKMHLKGNGFFERIINKQNPASSQSINVYDDYYNTKKYSVSGSFTTLFSKDFEMQNTINYNFFNRNIANYSQNLTEGTQTFLKDFDESIHNLFFRALLKQDLNEKKMKLLYGLDFNYDKGVSPRITGNNHIYELGLFGMFNFKLYEKLFFQPGFRFSFNNLTPVPIAPTINFRYEAHKMVSTRFSYSRGYRIPEIKELYFTFIDNNHNVLGNPNLTIETNDNFQFGIDIKPEKTTNRLYSYSTSFTSTYFIKNDAIDIVSTNVLNNEFKYLNVGKINGLIFNLDNRIKYKDYLFSLGTTIAGTKKTYNNVINQLDNLYFNGSINMNFTYDLRVWGTKFTILNKFNFKNNFTSYNLVKNEVELTSFPVFMYSDFNATKSFFDSKISVTVGVKNIFDIKNLRVTGYSGNVHNFSNNNEVNQLWGRTVFSSIVLNLDKL